MDVPIGSIIMWYKATSLRPVGWEVCDGNNGTPDLRGMFVVGASVDANRVATTSATHEHTNSATLAGGAHVHDITGSLGGAVTAEDVGTTSGGASSGISPTHTHVVDLDYASSGTHTHTTSNTVAANNLPPYVQVYYIMRIV